MKSYSVKSNAKRFARGIAAKHPEDIEAIEPVETEEGSREWWPAILIKDDVHTSIKIEAFDSYKDVAIIHGMDAGGEPTNEAADASGLKEMFDAVEPAGDIYIKAHATPEMVERGEIAVDISMPAPRVTAGLRLYIEGEEISDVSDFKLPELNSVAVVTAENSTFLLSASGRRMIEERDRLQSLKDADAIKDFEIIDVGEDGSVSSSITPHAAIESVTIGAGVLAGIAASLPPRVESSREEIDRRRAERRARIDAEKATGVRTPSGAKPKKISKKQIILDLVARSGGATQAEIEAATGWQRHTLRGYIAGTLRKILAPVGAIECRKVKTDDGEKETRYVFVRHEVK